MGWGGGRGRVLRPVVAVSMICRDFKELDPLLMVSISKHQIAVGAVQEDVFNHTSVEKKQQVQCDWEPTFCRWQRVFVGSFYGCLRCCDQSSVYCPGLVLRCLKLSTSRPLMEVGQWVVESWSQMSKISSFILKTLRRRWMSVSQWVRWATGCWWVVSLWEWVWLCQQNISISCNGIGSRKSHGCRVHK